MKSEKRPSTQKCNIFCAIKVRREQKTQRFSNNSYKFNVDEFFHNKIVIVINCNCLTLPTTTVSSKTCLEAIAM